MGNEASEAFVGLRDTCIRESSSVHITACGRTFLSESGPGFDFAPT